MRRLLGLAPLLLACNSSSPAADAGAPRDIVVRLHAEIGNVMKQPEVIERLAGAGVEPAMMSPEEFAAYIESETARYAKVVKSSGARVD